MINLTYYSSSLLRPISSCLILNATKHQWPMGRLGEPIKTLPPDLQLNEPLEVRDKNWKPVFAMFKHPKDDNITMTAAMIAMHSIPLRDYSIKNIYATILEYKKKSMIRNQRFIFERLRILGYDLQCAHFLIWREGKVRLKNSNDWIVDYNEEELPTKYTPHFHVEAIDASNTDILYEGLENLENLRHLKYANFSNCRYIDDFCIDRICGLFNKTIEYLDISHCKNITFKGLIALARLRKLKYLDITGLDHITDFSAVCIELEDASPNLYLKGNPHIDLYTSPLIDKNKLICPVKE